MDITVGSDVFIVGHDPEDGTEVYGLTYYVIATGGLGRRFIHEKTWCDRKRVNDPEAEFGYWFQRDNGEAKAAAEALADKVQAFVINGGELDLSHWHETYPAYGSQAYQERDAGGEFRDEEIARAVHSGEITEREAVELGCRSLDF